MTRKKQAGFTLIELMIVVAIIGILAVLAIFGVRKYLASAKTAEATNTIGQINHNAVAAYERESAPAEILAGGTTSSTAIHILCQTSTQVPVAIPANRKYQPNLAVGQDYHTGTQTVGWTCLKFEMSEPQYYAYQYSAGAACKNQANTAPAGAAWYSCATGDLNGDGTFGYYTTGGSVTNGQPQTFTEVATQNPEE